MQYKKEELTKLSIADLWALRALIIEDMCYLTDIGDKKEKDQLREERKIVLQELRRRKSTIFKLFKK